MFSVCLATALAQNPLIFLRVFFFLSVWCLFSNIGMCTDVTRPNKYLLSTGYFIIVHTQLFLLFYIVINKKRILRYIYKNEYFL